MISAKEIAKLAAKMVTIEDQQLIMSLHEDNLGLREDILQLREENGELKQQLDLREEMKFEDKFYWRYNKEGDRDGPYCPGCLDGRESSVRLHEESNGYLTCTNCDFSAKGPNWKKPVIRTAKINFY